MSVAAVQARSHWSLELKHARESLVRTAAWRAVVANPEAEDADLETAQADYVADTDLGRASALEKVVFYLLDAEAFPEDPAAALPRASIRHMTEASIRPLGGLSFHQSGEVWMHIELKVPDVYKDQQANAKFENALLWGENVISDIARGMADLRTTAGCLNIDGSGISLVNSGFYVPADVNGAFVYAAEMLIRHGGP